MQKTFVPQQIPEPVIHVEGEVPSDTPAFNLFRAVVREQQGNVVFSPNSAENCSSCCSPVQRAARGRSCMHFCRRYAETETQPGRGAA